MPDEILNWNASKSQVQLLEKHAELIEFGVSAHWLKPRSKAPVEFDWSTLPRKSLDDLCDTYRDGYNMGFRTGTPSKTRDGYFHVLDVDVKDASKAHEALAAARQIVPGLDQLPCVVSGNANGARRHFYMFTEHPLRTMRYLASDDGWKIELLGDGAQVVAPGSIHPDSGKRYRWAEGRDAMPDLWSLIGAPTVSADLFPAAQEPFEDLLADPEPERPDVPFETVKSALAAITDADDRDDWLKVGMALHDWDDGGATAFDLWGEWSRQSEKYNAKDQRRTWKSFGRNRRGKQTTIGTLLMLAEQHGWDRLKITADDFDDLPPLEPDFLDLLADADTSDDLDDILAAPDKGEKPSRLTFLSPEDCVAAPRRGYVVKGLLAPGDVGAIVGQPGCGKSTIAPYLAYCVAQGAMAFGLRTKQGGAFYVAAEDPHGMQQRVHALRETYGAAPGFKVVAGLNGGLLDKNAPDFKALVAAVKAERPALVVIDTMAVAFPGLEENDAAKMGRVVAVARALTRWGAAVLVVHHDTKAGDGLPRGHSILNGALDVSLALKRDGKIVRGYLSKNRNGPCDLDLAFTIQSRDVGLDEDGDAVTAALCNPLVEADQGDRSVRLKNATQRAFMDALYSMMDCSASEGVATKDLKMRCIASRCLSSSDKPDSQERSFRRVLKELSGQGYLSKSVRFEDGQEAIKPLYSLEQCLGSAKAGQERTRPDKANCPDDIARTDTDNTLRVVRLSGCPGSSGDQEGGG